MAVTSVTNEVCASALITLASVPLGIKQPWGLSLRTTSLAWPRMSVNLYQS